LFPQSTLPNFKQNEFSVVRQHEEFIWLHDSFVENEDYAGYIVRANYPSLALAKC
jgi:sorting nexin-5/6/32